jgi:hypothetical protein
MNYQQLVSVCSHTGIVILLVASHPSHTNINNGHEPETRVIVVKQSQANEKA